MKFRVSSENRDPFSSKHNFSTLSAGKRVNQAAEYSQYLVCLDFKLLCDLRGEVMQISGD
jgi:hypothetical protein